MSNKHSFRQRLYQSLARLALRAALYRCRWVKSRITVKLIRLHHTRHSLETKQTQLTQQESWLIRQLRMTRIIQQ